MGETVAVIAPIRAGSRIRQAVPWLAGLGGVAATLAAGYLEYQSRALGALVILVTTGLFLGTGLLLIAQHRRGDGALALLAGLLRDNPARIRSEPAFAMLCDVAPLPASSGMTQRHRLNRGGDRQANRALQMIVISRLRIDERTKAYAAKKTAEGHSKLEIIRCLNGSSPARSTTSSSQPPPDSPTRPHTTGRFLHHQPISRRAGAVKLEHPTAERP
jgi:hypothetical protein